jgi:hypothetical protein
MWQLESLVAKQRIVEIVQGGQMVPPSPDRLRRGLLFAPLVFVAHVLEESSGFVLWFNAHVTRGITADLFWAVNATALLITVLVTLLFWTTRSAAGVVLMVAWLSFLMLTNAGFHVTGAIVDRGYVPGLVTAILLYLPYCGWVAGQVVRPPLMRDPSGLRWVPSMIGNGSDFPSLRKHGCQHRAFSVIAWYSLRRSVRLDLFNESSGLRGLVAERPDRRPHHRSRRRGAGDLPQ